MKHLLSILLSFVALAAFAQEATVKSVAADPLNIAASKYPMTDLNGHTAPLVIVEALADNVEFKGNVLDGGVVRKTGEYWVYMGAGAKMLRIQSDKFLPVDIRFPDYGIPRLEPSATYVVRLALPQAAFPVATANTAQSSGGFPTEPVHLALCAMSTDGRTVYIKPEQWQVLSPTARAYYSPLGVCITDGSSTFLVELHDKEGGKKMNWSKALRYNSPTKEQSEIIAKNNSALNNALLALGGDAFDIKTPYWTKTDYNLTNAWYLNMKYGSVNYGGYDKTEALKVRAIVPVAASETKSAAPAHAASEFSTTPIHLALCATAPDGRAIYISPDQWQDLLASGRASRTAPAEYTPVGVCVSSSIEPFVIKLHDSTLGGVGQLGQSPGTRLAH